MKNELDLLRDEVLGLFPRLETKLGDDLLPDRREPLYRDRARLADGRYLVLTVGEFKRGKSSLLNALIEHRPFPVNLDVTTATVCTLSWGEMPQALLYLLPESEDEAPPPPITIDLSEVPRYATEQGRAKGDPPVARIDIVAPIPQLKSGLILVDTPGVGSMNPAHTAATRGLLPEANALLFVASAVQPLSTVELSFLARAYEVCPIVLTVVTMIDKTTGEDEIIAQTRARIAEVTGQSAEAVNLVGVSARRKDHPQLHPATVPPGPAAKTRCTATGSASVPVAPGMPAALVKATLAELTKHQTSDLGRAYPARGHVRFTHSARRRRPVSQKPFPNRRLGSSSGGHLGLQIVTAYRRRAPLRRVRTKVSGPARP